MTVARITMVEYISKEAADDFEPKYSEVAPKSIPEADNLILVRTAKTQECQLQSSKMSKQLKRL